MSEPRVTIRYAPGETPEALLARTLDDAGFWRAIESARRSRIAARRTADRTFRVVIKPDLDIYDLVFASGTEPSLVRELARLLVERGYPSVTVVDARNGRDGWLLNRESLVVADLAGYDFSGDVYQMAMDAPAANAWREADFRINFARSRTHEAFLYALCVHNLSGVSDEGVSVGVADRCLRVLREAPPHFNIIDAFVSCHGGAGERAPRPLKTATFIASADALLADVAGASKMDLDPYVSPVNATSFRALGLPPDYAVDGDLAPYPRWCNVHPLVADSARRRNEAPGLGPVAEAWFQRVDRRHFPFREFYQDRANSFVAPLLERVDDDSRSQWLVVVLNYAVAAIGKGIEAQHTMFAKTELERQRRSMQTDLSRFTEADYVQLPAHLAPYERLVRDSAPNQQGIRLRRFDDAVLFLASCELAIPYRELVRRVKIENAIQYMNDYIGGSVVSVARDGRGRVRLQAERNLYLQQPNWMVLFGGDVIDVEKIELMEYKRASQSIYWRTVASPNGSAMHDDGRVSFVDIGNGQTRVEVFTRQQFALPLFFKVVDINRLPGIRDPIVERAYGNFFTRTVANLEAEYEGRGYRVGHERHTRAGTGDVGSTRDFAHHLATALAALAELLRHRTDYAGVEEWFISRAPTAVAAGPVLTDDDGFRHFGPNDPGTRYDRAGGQVTRYFREIQKVVSDTPGLIDGLVSAVQRDFERYARTGVYEGPLAGHDGGGSPR